MLLIYYLAVFDSTLNCSAYLYSWGICLNSVCRLKKKIKYPEEFALMITVCFHGSPGQETLESR